MKLQKRKGMMLLLEAVLFCLIISLIGMSILDIQASALKNADAAGTGFEGQFLAVTKLNEINVTPYVNLKAEARAVITGTDFDRSVDMGAETILPDGNRQRQMTVNIYKTGEAVPRYSASVSPAVRETPFWSGFIVIYSGNLADIPKGWVLCDGSNGSPDLRGKFVVGYGNNTDRGITVNFGYKTSNVAMFHQHTVTGNTDGHALTIAEMPQHNHSMDTALTITGNAQALQNQMDSHYTRVGPSYSNESGGNQPHNHNLLSLPTSDQYQIPPYYALAYIMKV